MPNTNRGRAEWEKYKIEMDLRVPSNTREAFDEVSHVAHVAQAKQILIDGHLRAGLVYDESRLNTSRLAVTWVSANTWGPGSIYGNVAFKFLWEPLIGGKRFYWVESMEDYHPAAFRILISGRDHSSSKQVVPYDPERDDGPLRFVGGSWYRRADKTSEFLIDEDIDLSACVEILFVDHHKKYCRLHGPSCSDKIASKSRTGGHVLAFVLGNGIHVIDQAFKKSIARHGAEGLTGMISFGSDGISRALAGSSSHFTGDGSFDAHAVALLQGALALYGAETIKRARELTSLLSDSEVFDAALAELVNVHFGTSGWAP